VINTTTGDRPRPIQTFDGSVIVKVVENVQNNKQSNVDVIVTKLQALFKNKSRGEVPPVKDIRAVLQKFIKGDVRHQELQDWAIDLRKAMIDGMDTKQAVMRIVPKKHTN
jgi:hypothetical protein